MNGDEITFINTDSNGTIYDITFSILDDNLLELFWAFFPVEDLLDWTDFFDAAFFMIEIYPFDTIESI